jgi:hypothetical protein
MSDLLTTWKNTAAEALSFRRMYILASEVSETELASFEMRLRAMRVKRTLEAVIDLPIADAKVLAKARKQFGKLTSLLAHSV